MLNNMHNKDIKTLGYVMRRTNYGEADRILNIITPNGKMTAIAKGARKEKSKLAGGIEIFTLAEYNIHFGKSEFGVVTGVKVKKHYNTIIKDLGKMELAASILKRVNTMAEGSDNSDGFCIVDQSLRSLDAGGDVRVIETWCLMNIKKSMGEEMNLYRDVSGEKLEVGKKYNWDMCELAFVEDMQGEYDTDDIKLLRLMASGDLAVVQRVKLQEDRIDRILRLVKMVI